MLYFNTPFCKSIVTRVDKCFLTIVGNNSKKDHPFAKVFKRKTLYSCMQNMNDTHQIMPQYQRILSNKKNECATAEDKNARLVEIA